MRAPDPLAALCLLGGIAACATPRASSPPTAPAQPPAPTSWRTIPPSGISLDVFVPVVTLGGELDGNQVLVAGDEALLLPDLTPGPGLGAAIGFQDPDRGKYLTLKPSFGYQRTFHSWSNHVPLRGLDEDQGGNLTGTADVNTLDLGMQIGPKLRSVPRLQPHVRASGSFTWIDATGITASVSPTGVVEDLEGDGRMAGLGASVRGGATVWLTSWAGLIGAGGYRWLGIMSANHADTENAIDAGGWYGQVSLSFVIPWARPRPRGSS